MEKWGGFNIKKENVILFDNTIESIQPLIDKISRGNMTFGKDIEKRCELLGRELPGDFKKQDKEEGTVNYSEFKGIMMILEETNRGFF
jgi:hypothetical protein